MSTSSFDGLNSDRIFCSLSNTSFKHLLELPYVLPCKHSACKKCIIELVRKCGNKCNNPDCSRIYLSSLDIDCMEIDFKAEAYLKKNAQTIFQLLKDNFIKFFNEFEGIEFLTNIDKKCEFIEYEIDIRIESLKEQLENLRQTMHEKLNSIKNEAKGFVQTEEIEKKKQEYRQFIDDSEYFDGLDLMLYHKQLVQYQEEIEKMIVTAPKVEFEINDEDIDELLIGKFQSVCPYKYEKIVNSRTVTLPHKFLNRIAFLDCKKQFLITDREDRSIKVLDLDGNYLGEFNPNTVLEYPFAICVDHKNQILVGDYRKQRIFVFSTDFRYLNEFGDNCIKNPNSMVIDRDLSTTKLYVTDYWHNEVTIWSADDHSFITFFDVDSPAYIQISGNLIFVVSALDLTLVENTNKIDEIAKGFNCIFVIDKTTFCTIRTIALHNWIDPYGLHIDKNQNILITASEVDENQCLSESAYLFNIDQKGNLLNKLELKKYIPIDFYVYENKILFISFDTTPIHVDEFN